MSDEPKIMIQPDTYRGWKLKYCKSHDGNGDYWAECDRSRLFAPTLDKLLGMIRDSENHVQRLARPIKVMHKHERYHSTGEYEPATVTMVENDFIYIRLENGEIIHTTGEELAKETNNGRRSTLSFVMDTKENRRKIHTYTCMYRKAEKLTEQADCIKKSLTPLTGVDVKESL